MRDAHTLKGRKNTRKKKKTNGVRRERENKSQTDVYIKTEGKDIDLKIHTHTYPKIH